MKISKMFLFTAAVYALLSLGGCAALYKNYGVMVPHKEATQAFESYRIDPDLNYYVSGSDSFPNAIMGLNRAYTLNSPLWKKIEMKPDLFRNLVSSMQQMAADSSKFQRGFAILDNQGRQVGIWYSPLDASTFIKMEDEKTVWVGTPPHDTYHMNRRDDPTTK